MKKFSLLFCLIFISFGLLGSHMAGGEIWYEYTGDANNPYKYRVWLQFYRDVTGIAAPMNEEISVKSSCFPDQCVNLIYAPFTLEPGSDTAYGSVAGSILTPDLEECVDVNSGGTFVQTEVYRFYADVTLDGTCHDWTFGFNENARNPNSNLTGAGTFYIEAQLNNTLGPNSGPVFVNPAAKSFCVGSPFVWSQAAVEPDGDSLYFDFGSPLTSADACPTNPNPMQFAAGYSKTQPMVTSSGISINHGKGTFRFTPSQPEVDVINVTVTEYRWDSLSGQYLVNGTSVRDLQVPIMNQCKASAVAGPRLDFTDPRFNTQLVNKDSLSNLLAGLGITKAFIDSTPVNNGFDYEVGIVQYDCFDTAVSLSFNIDVLCESFAPEADEFRIISGTDTIARPIVGYEYTCQPDLTVSSVKLKLHRPLDVNGDYYLQVQKGSDGNTLTNRCGFELQEFYTMIIRVSNCPQLNYELENVSVAEDEHTTLNWWVDPQSFTPETEKLFNQWNILRAKANEAPFYTIARLSKATDVNTRSYTDTSLTAFDVDKNPFRYRVQLVQNHDFKAPTNQVRSILLTDTLNEDGTAWNLYWTHYNGWQAPTFELFKAKVDSSLPAPQWENMAGPDSNFYKATFLKPKPLTQEASGLYVVKVEASDMLNPANSFISESNWIYFELKIDPEDPPVEEPVVPNVFTPNNDDNNDEFFVKAPGFKRANIEVYNRWGTLVHRSSEDVENGETLFWNGTDFNSGGDLADGVYYYVINLEGANAEDSETLQGQVNIFKN